MSLDRILIAAVCGAAALLTLLLYIFSTESDRIAAAAIARHGLEIEQGATLYSTHCRGCHGIRGEGVGQLGPALADEHFFTARLAEVGWQSTLHDYVVSTTAHGRMIGTRPVYAGNGASAVMPPWDQRYGGPLRQDEIDALAAFILNWQPTAMGRVQLSVLELPEESPNDPKLISSGEQIFQQDCARCHIYKSIAQATLPGPDLTDIAVQAGSRREELTGPDYIRESLLIPEAHVVSDYTEAARINGCGAILSLTELNAVTAFLLQ